LAKSNLKNLNNNGVTQTSHCSLYSKNSYIYYTYIYLNFLFFFRFFFVNNSYKSLIDSYFLKFYNKKKTIYKYTYSSFFLKYYNVEKFNKLNYNIVVKVFFFNGLITHLYDFFLIKRYVGVFKKKIIRKKLSMFKPYNNISSVYKNLIKLFDKYF